MPYQVIKHGPKWFVERTGSTIRFGPHDAEPDAARQCSALQAIEPKPHGEARTLHLVRALGSARTEMINNREHLVVPVVALMEGVIHAVNAETPEFVSADTLRKAAASWNGKPVTLGHPKHEGKQCSAAHTNALASHIGVIRNSRVEGTKMLQEACIDKVKAKMLDPDMLQRLLDDQWEEVSVGAFVVTDNKAGDHHGKSYKASWLETGGDHLAFLPGGRGACSIEMGCGAHRAAMRVCEAGLELLGDVPGHEFHGNQHIGGGKPETHEQAVENLEQIASVVKELGDMRAKLASSRPSINRDYRLEKTVSSLAHARKNFEAAHKDLEDVSGKFKAAIEMRRINALHMLEMFETLEFNDNQPRDENGRWTGSGGAADKQFHVRSEQGHVIGSSNDKKDAENQAKNYTNATGKRAQVIDRGKSKRFDPNELVGDFEHGPGSTSWKMKGAAAGTVVFTTLEDQSLDDRIRAVTKAVYKEYAPTPGGEAMPSGPMAYAQQVFDDRVIVRKGDELFSVDYTVNKDGEVELGKSTKVKMAYVAATKHECECGGECDACKEIKTAAGARHSSGDMKLIQAVHDHAMNLGAACDRGNYDT